MPISSIKRSFWMLIWAVLLLFPLTIAAVWGPEAATVSQSLRQGYSVFLTFDDGPSVNTEKVLDILRREQVPATFFVIGAATEQGMALYNRILEEGHSLGLHTYTHDVNRIYRSMNGYKEDFEKIADWVLETTGSSPKICRMVGGSCTYHCPAILREEILTYLVEQGYACYDWDIDGRDSGRYAVPPRLLADHVIEAARKKPGQDLIVLLHDDAQRVTLPAALPGIIAYFRAQGYHFDALREDTESVKRIMPKSR